MGHRDSLPYLAEPDGVVVDFQNGINDSRVATVAGTHRALGCVITISAGMYEPGHAMRTDTAHLGFKIGEHDGKDTPRARELAALMCAVAETKVTTNLFGERWSKLAINCMANPLAGLTGFGTLEVRTVPKIAAVGVHVGAEAIMVGRAVGYEVEPIYGIATQRYVDAYNGQGPRHAPRRDRRDRARARRRRADAAAGRGEGAPHGDRLPERLRVRGGRPARREDALQRRHRRGRPRSRRRLQARPAHLDPVIGMLPAAGHMTRAPTL